MAGHKIYVKVSWTDDNFGCSWFDEDTGSVVVTAKTLQRLKEYFEESLKLHIQGCLEDGDKLPDWLVRGDYDIEYDLDPSALLRNAESYTTIAAISRASGINQKQLSHYASGLKHPRPKQVERIKNGLRILGSQLMALS